MKKLLLTMIVVTFAATALTQTTNYPMKFRYNNSDTLIDKAGIYLWKISGTFPAYLDWADSPFALQPVSAGQIGLFTDSTHSYTSGQDIGLAFIKSGASGFFMNDYHKSNIGMMVNNSETPNATVIKTTLGLMLRATTGIASNTEIIIKYQDILNLFPTDKTIKLMVHY